MSSLFEQYANLSVIKKAMIQPAITILMLTVLLVSIYLSLNSVIDTVDDVVNDLAPDSDTAAHMMEKIYAKRLQVKNYIKTSSDASKNQFTVLADELNEIMAKAKLEISNPLRVELLKKIEQLNQEYDASFYNIVVANMDVRNEIVDSRMNVEGPQAEKNLSKIMESVHQDGDGEAGYFNGETLRTLLLARLYAFKYLNDNTDASKERTFHELNQAEQWANKLISALQNYDRQQYARATLANIKNYNAAFKSVVTAIESRNNAIRVLDTNGPLIAETSVDLRDSVFAAMVDEGKLVEQKLITTERVSLMIYLIATLLGLVISKLLAKGIVTPIQKIRAGISNVAKGDLTVKIDVESKDELGSLAKQFNTFVSELRTLISNISVATNTLSVAADTTSNITKETSENVLNQQNETSFVATAINQMAATVNEVSTNTLQASSSASEGDTQAQKGNEIINGIVISINHLVAEIDSSSTVITELKDESQTIGTVLDVIKSIAEQTNLLALNAAIEAARAGEQGRGFAVVADEVRSLAQKTQDSTQEIETLISTLQSNADNAVSSMMVNKNSIHSLADKTTLATESLKTISDLVTTIADMNAQIAKAATEQNNVVEEINKNVNNIKAISDETSIASEKVLASSIEVSTLSNELKSQVSQFKIA